MEPTVLRSRYEKLSDYWVLVNEFDSTLATEPRDEIDVG